MKNKFGTKAETLLLLSKEDFNVPLVYFFTFLEWKTDFRKILFEISTRFSEFESLAIRSSALAEDSSLNSMAGAFDSVLNVNSKDENEISLAIAKVIKSFDGLESNQVLVQPMIRNVLMSGVIMTKVLDDGSPYYVINYDDSSGKTDTVTNGLSINKTVYIYNGVTEKDFDSHLLWMVIELVWKLENFFDGIPLDIEFAIDEFQKIHLLQVRKITTTDKWNHVANAHVSERIEYLAEYVDKLIKPRANIFGEKSLLGLMPDWNPAEMIGVVPHPLSMSLYRELITKSAWRIAREKMGYRKMPNVDLMVSLFGRTYIDVRNSINSFLPEGLDSNISEKVVNANLDRLKDNPQLHDKIEFEVVHTAYDFQFIEKFQDRYNGVLDKSKLLIYRSKLRELTIHSLSNRKSSSLNKSLKRIEQLKKLQSNQSFQSSKYPFAISDQINILMGECYKFGTIPFSMIARHAFISEALLRSAVNMGAISVERLSLFKKSFRTVAGEMSEDFFKVCQGIMKKSDFLEIYGHLRPSSYDILSPRYLDRQDLFEGHPKIPKELPVFELSPSEERELNILLAENGFDSINAEDLLHYAKISIIGREYAKFIFTKHLSNILEYVAEWGECYGIERSDMSMMSINEILNILFTPLTKVDTAFFKDRIEKAKSYYNVSSSFKLSYLIRSTRDIFVVPQQRSNPNFVGQKRIEAPVYLLTPYTQKPPDLKGFIVCIEGADPGYDWIFSRDIAGLITKYGGANSHMAIRCAEYGLPAAIGCGEQPFERVLTAGKCLLDCRAKRLEPISFMI